MLRGQTDVSAQKETATRATLQGRPRCIMGSLEFYAPKLSYIMDFSSTPKSTSIFTTAFDIGPGPHI